MLSLGQDQPFHRQNCIFEEANFNLNMNLLGDVIKMRIWGFRWNMKLQGLRGNGDGGPQAHFEEQGACCFQVTWEVSRLCQWLKEPRQHVQRRSLVMAVRIFFNRNNTGWHFGWDFRTCMPILYSSSFSIPGPWVLNGSKGPVIMVTEEK